MMGKSKGEHMEIRRAGPSDASWIEERLIESWGSTRMVLRGEMVEAMRCEALIAGDREGLLQHRLVAPGVGEIVTLEAFTPFKGIGTALVAAYLEEARTAGLGRVVVITTNDNLDALRFYQTRGFAILAIRPGAVAAARALKPEIPLTGSYGIPLRDEIELVHPL
jgi:N-acetylglutamate synthase-like GNAT family acetyltransferase